MPLNSTLDDHSASQSGGTGPTHPVLIVNPKSGNGRAASVNLIAAANERGVETVTMQPGDDLAKLASLVVDRGCDHLMMAGGDGSLALVAEVAIARGVPFSCVPVGTRNHFAMDLGLDRRNPVQALDAAFDGIERSIDVGMVAGEVFLNNVSFGLYATAIADPDYRRHRARSMADAAVETASRFDSHLVVSAPDGRIVEDIEILLISNNPYRIIGPPDFAKRPALDSGALGAILADRRGRLKRGPAAFTRWEAPMLTVQSGSAEIRAGVDGELRTYRAPVEITMVPKALRVIVPRLTQSTSLKESIGQLNDRVVMHLSGLPALPGPDELSARSPLFRRIHKMDEALFERVAGWESPALDRIMPRLSNAASHSKIWLAVTLAMSLVGDKKARRTTVKGLVAVGITSFLANIVAKSLFGRSRPTDPVPEARRLPVPSSTSMPSGHTASGAAFARVVGSAYPILRLPLNALAAAIGFSRVYTGVHYPSDVAAGWLLGRGVGTAVLGLAATAARIRRVAARLRMK